MLFRQQVKTVTHIVELTTFVQDCIRMHGGTRLPESLTARRRNLRKFVATTSWALVTREDGVNRLPARHVHRPLRCYSNVMEGRSNRLKCLNLGRSIDHSCKR